MADRLVLLAVHAARAKPIIEDHCPLSRKWEKCFLGVFSEEACELAEYDLESLARSSLSDALLDAGIAHEFRIGNGTELHKQKRDIIRFTHDGRVKKSTIDPMDLYISVEHLMAMVNSSKRPAQKLASVEYYIRSKHAVITPLPWAEQDANGRVYQAKQLLKPVIT